jgi:hypothetical protein
MYVPVLGTPKDGALIVCFTDKSPVSSSYQSSIVAVMYD